MRTRHSTDGLRLSPELYFDVAEGGLFVSRGRGIHPDRTMGAFVLIFVRGGTLFIQEEKREFAVEQDQTLLLWPGRRHFGTRPYLSDLSFYWVHFAPLREEIKAPIALNEEHAEAVVPQRGRPLRPEVLTVLFDRFLTDQELGRHTPLSLNCLLLLMLGEIADQRPLAPSSENPPEPADRAALAVHAEAYIRTHFHLPLTASGLAKTLGYSPEYLSRAYRKAYGQTVTEAIHRHRIQCARRLLLGSDDTVEAIARASGFSEVGYFRRLFRRYEGMTPLIFRRRFARPYINTE